MYSIKPKDLLIAKEREDHLAYMKWAKFHPICRDYLIHIPNEGKRSRLNGHILVLEGLRSGVSDLLLAYPVSPYHGLFLELKRKRFYKISKKQQEWIDRMNSVGYKAQFAFGLDDAIAKTLLYLGEARST